MQNLTFSKVYTSNYSRFLRYAYKLTHSLEDAKDLLQDASIKAYKHLDQLNDLSNFSPWFYRVLYTSYVSKFNKKKRRMELITTNGQHPSLFFNKSKVSNSGFETLKQDDVLKCIDQLDPKYRSTFLMYTFGYSYKEISDSHDIPIGTVKSRINMARQKMKKIPYLTSAA